MAQSKFNIEVLSVSQETHTKTPKGGYNQIEVAYKNLGTNKVEGKKLIDFKFPEVYKTFKNAKQGDKFTVTSEKPEGEKFWNWSNVTSTTGSPEEPAEAGDGAVGETEGVSVADSRQRAGSKTATAGGLPAAGSKTATAGRGRVTGSNYETPQERAKRQVYIVRQSSLTTALDLIKFNASEARGDVQIAPEAVIEIARKFEEFVFEPKATSPAAKFDDMQDDIPF